MHPLENWRINRNYKKVGSVVTNFDWDVIGVREEKKKEGEDDSVESLPSASPLPPNRTSSSVALRVT